jgi:signal transduction histidine kinase
VSRVSDELLDAAMPDPERRQAIKALGLRSYMIVPIVVQERAVGAITFIAAESGREYEQHDLILAKEIARRASLAIENARLYEDAREAVRVRDAFLTVASHELRTPITTVLLQAQSLLREARRSEGPMSPERVLRRAARIEAHVERLNELVEQLLDVSRISAGHLQLFLEDVDLAELVREVVRRHEDEARNARCALVVHAEPGLSGRWDRLRLEQIVGHLLANALKYGRGEPVEIDVRPDPEGAVLVVRDHGIGVPKEAQERIFERFGRLGSERHYGGFGLGLWITRHLAQTLGGRVSVDSRSGEGAAFTVVLPWVAPQGRSAAPPPH